MDRYQFEDLISDFIENKLSMIQRKDFETYLDENPEAMQQLDSVKQVIASMKSMPEVSTSTDFMKNLNKRIAAEKETQSVVKTTRSFAGYTPLMASLSAVVVVAVVLLGLEFIPEATNQATFTPTMAEQQVDDLPVLPTQPNDELLAENEDDSTHVDEDMPNTTDFKDRIQLVGDRRP
jgi:cell division septum initiation protein DivIVA